MDYIYVPAFWGAFREIWFSDRGGFIRAEGSPNYIYWVYLAHIIVKSAQFGQFGCFSFENSILMGGKLGKKIGIEIVRFFEVRQAHPSTILVKVTPPPGCRVFNSFEWSIGFTHLDHVYCKLARRNKSLPSTSRFPKIVCFISKRITSDKLTPMFLYSNFFIPLFQNTNTDKCNTTNLTAPVWNFKSFKTCPNHSNWYHLLVSSSFWWQRTDALRVYDVKRFT